MKLTSTNYSSGGRYIEYTLHNVNLLTGTSVLEGIYNSIFTKPSFKVGENKVIIVTGKDLDNTFNVHPNVSVTNDTTLQQYLGLTEKLVQNRYDESGYLHEMTNYFIVKVWKRYARIT